MGIQVEKLFAQNEIFFKICGNLSERGHPATRETPFLILLMRISAEKSTSAYFDV